MSEADDNIKLSENLTPGERSREGPGNQPGRISGSITAEKSGEGPGNQSGGISRLSATGGKGIKRKLNTKSYSEKYKAIIEVEEGKKSRKQIAAEYGVPQNTLSTWLKNKDSIKSKYVSGDIEPYKKKSRTAKFPEVDEAMLKWFENARSQNVSVEGPQARSVDDDSDNDDTIESTDPTPADISTKQATEACDTIRAFLESIDNNDNIISKFDDIERYISRKHLAVRCGKQTDITSFFKKSD